MANEEHLNILFQGVKIWNNWRKSNKDLIPDLTNVNLNKKSLKFIDFRGVNLEKANFQEADLEGADFRDANLKEAIFKNTILDWSGFRDANLQGAIFWKAYIHRVDLSGADLSKAVLTEANLGDSRLWKANLSKSYLENAELSNASLREADLTGASLAHAHVVGTDFTGAHLTGICVQDWNVNSTTKFDNVICDYIYLRQPETPHVGSSYGVDSIDRAISIISSFTDRRPQSGNFKEGEFAALFREVVDTIDLIFREGIDWKAFIQAFKEVRIQNEDTDLDIQSIENKGSGAFVIKVSVPQKANKEDLHQQLITRYEHRLALLESKVRLTEEQLEDARQKYTDMKEIAKVLAEQPIYNIKGDVQMVEIRLGDGNVINGDFVIANKIEDSFNKVHTAQISNELKDSLKHLALEVNQMAQHLSKEKAEDVANDLQTLSDEIISKKPRKEILKVTAKRILEIAKFAGEFGKSVVDIIKTLGPYLGG